MIPITIKSGTFKAHLYDVNSLMELPLANVRKLWKLMLKDTVLNKDAIAAIQNWLPTVVDHTEDRLSVHTTLLEDDRVAAETLRRTVEVFGSMATKEHKAELRNAQRRIRTAEKKVKTATTKHDRATKLQIIFNEMTQI